MSVLASKFKKIEFRHEIAIVAASCERTQMALSRRWALPAALAFLLAAASVIHRVRHVYGRASSSGRPALDTASASSSNAFADNLLRAHDRDGDGRLGLEELRAALATAGIGGRVPVVASTTSKLRHRIPSPALRLARASSSGTKHQAGLPPAKTLWCFFEYPNGLPTARPALNMETWRRNLPSDWRIVLLNDTNAHVYVPDLPLAEYRRLPYSAAKSDVLRAGVLYHHGGLYMDTDFLLMHALQPGDPLSVLLGEDGGGAKGDGSGVDLVAYGDGPTSSTECATDKGLAAFASNWMASRPKNRFSEHWWTAVKHKLTRTCRPGEFQDAVDKICCHEEKARPEVEATRKCHIPWGYLEHLKVFDHDKDHDMENHGGGKRRGEEDLSAYSSYCVNGDHNFMPMGGDLYFMELHKGDGAEAAAKTRGGCFELTTMNSLVCKKQGGSSGDTVVTTNFFRRGSFHLFNSGTAVPPGLQTLTREELLGGNLVLSELYRRSLGIAAHTPISTLSVSTNPRRR